MINSSSSIKNQICLKTHISTIRKKDNRTSFLNEESNFFISRKRLFENTSLVREELEQQKQIEIKQFYKRDNTGRSSNCFIEKFILKNNRNRVNRQLRKSLFETKKFDFMFIQQIDLMISKVDFMSAHLRK